MAIIDILLPTFAAVLLGYVLGKIIRIDIPSVTDILVYAGLPALAFVSVLGKKIVLADAGKVWASELLIMFGCGIAAWIVFRILKEKHSGLYIPITIMNTVNMPFPIISLAYGVEGLMAATLFYIPNSIISNSLGLYIASGKAWKEGIKTMLKVPPTYAATSGLALNLLNINVPDEIMKPLQFFSQMTIPLMLFLLGASLTKIRISSLRTTLIASFLRIGVGLMFGYLSVYIFGLEGVLRSVVILDSAMPAAVNSAVLTLKYNNEAELVSSVVFVTTLASLATIPFLLSVV